MELTRAHFGETPSLGYRSDALLVRNYRTDTWFVLDWGPAHPTPGPNAPLEEHGTEPFARGDFGSSDRLAWPAAACPLDRAVRLVHWDARYAAWIEDGALVLADATRDRLARVDAGELLRDARPNRAFVHARHLWFVGDTQITWCALATLEALFAQPAGPLAIRVREVYPMRRQDKSTEASVKRLGEHAAYVQPPFLPRWIEIPLLPGLAVGMEVMLFDELHVDRYREIALPGEPRRALHDGPGETTIDGTLAIEAAVDPAGGLAPPAPTRREDDLDRLFGALADDPDDAAAPAVIVDLLEEAGEPYARALALLAGGATDDAARRAALGPLASYLGDVAYRHGLPRTATLSADAPLDKAIGEAVANDRRLGFFHTLRIGDGNFGVYARLVGSSRAAGLRHIDAPRLQILEAVIAGGRRGLVRLSGVRFALREVHEALAHPVFDGVREIETETAVALAGRLFDFIERDELGFFRRAPRHLVVRERNGAHSSLLVPAQEAWPRLPLAALTVAGTTLRR